MTRGIKSTHHPRDLLRPCCRSVQEDDFRPLKTVSDGVLELKGVEPKLVRRLVYNSFVFSALTRRSGPIPALHDREGDVSVAWCARLGNVAA